MPTWRAARSPGVSLSESGMRRCACRNPSAPKLPTALRILSANTGVYSTQWPSASTTGCLRFLRISSGLRCALIWLLQKKAALTVPDAASEPMPREFPSQTGSLRLLRRARVPLELLRLAAGGMVQLHGHQRGSPELHRTLERRLQVLGIRDEPASAAERFHHPVVARTPR